MKCLDVYKNLNIVAINGILELSPCCVSKTMPATTLDFKNNEYLVSIRKSWDNGIVPDSCVGCTQFSSRMSGSNSWYQEHNVNTNNIELIRLDFWTGDLCNLRCAICGPSNSSAWKQELGIAASSTVNKFWKDLDTSKLKSIHFNGGEPLLSKEHVEFLQALPNKDQIEINYNTNGTIRPSTNLCELWSKFKLVMLDFSIDDVGERFEYQRYPAKWADVVSNLRWFIDYAPVNCMFAINTTVSTLNYHNLQNLTSWLQLNFAENRLGDPCHYRQQTAFGVFAVGGNLAQMLQFLNNCDARRGTDWYNTFPELRYIQDDIQQD